jgi:hypothetical protein
MPGWRTGETMRERNRASIKAASPQARSKVSPAQILTDLVSGIRPLTASRASPTSLQSGLTSMAHLSKSEVIKNNPIGEGLNAFRHSKCASLGLHGSSDAVQHFGDEGEILNGHGSLSNVHRSQKPSARPYTGFVNPSNGTSASFS